MSPVQAVTRTTLPARLATDAPADDLAATGVVRAAGRTNDVFETPGPQASTFELSRRDFAPLTSLFGRGSNGVMNGTFYVAVKNGEPYLQLPLIFSGLNRLTPEYRSKVIAPLEKAFADAGRPIETLMDGTDYRPKGSELTPTFAAAYAEALKTEIIRAFGEMGIKTEVPMQFRDIALTPFEQRLMAGGKLTAAELQNPDARVMDLLWRNKSKKFRDPDTFTFLLQPVPNLVDGYVATEDYNPTVGSPPAAFLHEMSHYLFEGTYEGYQDAYSPGGSVMGDVAAQRVAAAAGKKVSFSSMEQERILSRFVEAAKAAGQKTGTLEARLTVLRAQNEAVEKASSAGKIDKNGTLTLLPSGKTLHLNARAYAPLLAKADLRKPVLVVFDERGAVSHINAWAKPIKVQGETHELGYAKFMPGEMGLTSNFIGGIIKEKLQAR